MRDLGLHIDPKQLHTSGTDIPPADEIELMRRTFWSCYVWDKCISLYLGRAPTVQQVKNSPKLEFATDSADDDIWSPYFGTTDHRRFNTFAPRPSRTSSCFLHFCRVMVIFNKIMMAIYMTRQIEFNRRNKVIMALSDELASWRSALPTALWIDAQDAAHPCHVFTLKYGTLCSI